MYENIGEPKVFSKSFLGEEKGIRVEYSSNELSR
jgi:hypothetical protein